MTTQHQDEHDHPLVTKATHFFEGAGFHLTPTTEPLLYETASFKGEFLKQQLPSNIYSRILLTEALNDDRVLAIRRQVRQADPTATVVFVVTNRRPTESGWAQIGTLRLRGFTLLPLDSSLLNEGLSSNRERTLLRREVEQRLGADYDPYDVRNPVSGALSFFGREALLETTIYRVNRGRPVGIFGLRKMGKSSVLRALGDRTEFPVAIINMQTIGRTGNLRALYRRVLRYWQQDITIKTGLEWEIPSIRYGDPTNAFIRETLNLLTWLEERLDDVQLGLFLDEVELLVPRPNNADDLDRYLDFMRAMRGLIDEDGRLSLVVASLNPVINRLNAWGGEQNPAFSLFQEINLPPLTPEDTITMVRNIGRQVGLVYSDESLQAIAHLSGGHPFLARQLCSLIYKRREYQVGRIEIGELPGAVHHFIYDDMTAAYLDNGLWQEAANPAVWGSVGAQTNQYILLDLAQAEHAAPRSRLDLLNGDVDARESALINLERYHFIHQAEAGLYAIRFGLLREWLRRRKLGLTQGGQHAES